MVTTSETEKITAETRARVVLGSEVGILERAIAEHHRHFDALVLAIDLFGDDPDTVFSLQSDAAWVHLTVDDVNTSLREIHHTMRSAGWKPVRPFNKKGLKWDWSEETDSPVITFYIGLSSNATCKRVQVGTEQTPVYEIRCEDNGQPFEIEDPAP